MSYTFELFNSNSPNKKYKVIIYGNGVKIKTLHFGDSRYKDFIEYSKINKNLANERKRLYLIRHNKEDSNNFLTAGYWSKNILWSYPTLEASYKDVKKRFFIL